MTRLRFSFLAFVLIWAGSFLACSKSTPTTSPNSAKSAAAPAASTSSGLPHPCTLLTAKDAEEVFGAGAQLKRHSDTTCMIEGADLLPDGLIAVTITLIDPKDWDASKKTVFATYPKEKSVSGIGDDAYTFSDGIVFHKGKVLVNVATSGYLGPKPKAEVAKHLAEQVAARL
ncbi:MAG: hypothetical protein ABSC21_23250 [Terriglobia bacterium]